MDQVSAEFLKKSMRNYVNQPRSIMQKEIFKKQYSEYFPRGLSISLFSLMQELELVTESLRLEQCRMDFICFLELEMKKQVFYWEERERCRELAHERLQIHLFALRKDGSGTLSMERLARICYSWLTPPHALVIVNLFRKLNTGLNPSIANLNIDSISWKIEEEFMKEQKRERVLAGQRLMEYRVLVESRKNIKTSGLDETQAEKFRNAYQSYFQYPTLTRIPAEIEKKADPLSEIQEKFIRTPERIAREINIHLEQELNIPGTNYKNHLKDIITYKGFYAGIED